MIILVVDDEGGVRDMLHKLLSKKHEVILSPDGKHALKELGEIEVDLVITDFQMPVLSGIELIRQGKKLSPSTSFILMTAFGTIDQAVEAIRLGADDYFLKPFDISELEHRIERVENLRSWKFQQTLVSEVNQASGRLIGASPNIREAHEFIQKVGMVPSPVLLLGPTGSGKEVVAQAIHEAGNRSKHPFIAINCASLNEQLMESELYGHEKGSFTGATAAKLGKFELARGGTLFLDEVGELPLTLQVKLLRVIQEKEFYHVGGVRKIKSEVRLIAATNRNLTEMVAAGTFREDLFFRLNVLVFKLLPLEQRRPDIPMLVRHVWEKLTSEFGRKLTLSAAALECLNAYSFPGNVRELQNILERLVVLGGGSEMVEASALPIELQPGFSQRKGRTTSVVDSVGRIGFTEIMEDIEARLFAKALELSGGNQAKAATILKMSRGMFLHKIKRYSAHSVLAPFLKTSAGKQEAA